MIYEVEIVTNILIKLIWGFGGIEYFNYIYFHCYDLNEV